MWKTSPAVRDLVLDERFGGLVAALAGADEVRLYHDHALIKLPWANPTNWHADNPYDPYRSPEAIMLWIRLDDADARNGCLHFCPEATAARGSMTAPRSTTPTSGRCWRPTPSSRPSSREMAEVAAGSRDLINGMTAHAAGANMTRRPRRAFSMLFIPGRCGYTGQPGALPSELVARLQPGDILDDDQHLPCSTGLTGNGPQRSDVWPATRADRRSRQRGVPVDRSGSPWGQQRRARGVRQRSDGR